MASGFFFNGNFTVTPTTASVVDDSAEAPANLTVGNTLCIIGVSDGGQPGTVYSFGGPAEVQAALVSGPLCYAAMKAFAASDELNAPGLVKCVRVGAATPAMLPLNDASAKPCAVVSAQSYGVTIAPPRMMIQAGSTAGTLRVSTAQGQNYEVQDNIGGFLFSATYTGAAASALVIATGVGVLVQAPIGTQLGGLNFTQYTVVQDIVDYINSVPGFTAAVLNGKGQQPVLGALDSAGTGTNVKGATSSYAANLAAFLTYMNGPAQPTLTAVAATGGSGAPPGPIAWTYLSGGTTPVITLADYVNALTILQGQDIQWLAALSGDPAVHAAVDAHVQYMSTVGRKERRALVGPVQGTSMAAAMALPINLNSDRTAIVWPGYYDYNTAGVLTLMDPYYSAAVVAAGFAGSDPGEPMTNKAFTMRGLEVPIRNPTDTDQLIQSGLLCLDTEVTGIKVVRSNSTWLVNNNFNRVEISTGAATDYVVRTVRAALSTLKGRRGDPLIIGRAITIAETALRALAKPPPLGPGVIVGDAASPAYQGITASLAGDILTVSFQASPVIPVNFIGISVAITPYSGTLSA